MNSKIKILSNGAAGTALLAALLFTSCARDDFDWLVGTAINVTASTEKPATRAASDIQTTTFDTGAEINAYYKITGGDAIGRTPTILTAAAATEGKNRLTPDVQPYYPSTGTVDIMALYPKEIATKDITNFTVLADQQAEADYKKSDLMWAGITGQGKTPEDVNLEFKHVMTKMTVSVTGKEGVLVKKVSLVDIVRKVDITTLTADAYTLADIDRENDTKDAILLASTEATDVNNTLSGSVLFPGQTISGNFIKVETNYGDAYFSVTNKAFAGGSEYSADLVVKRQDVGFVTTITDWANNGGSIAVPPGSSAGLKIAVIPDQHYDGTPKAPDLEIWYYPNDELNGQLGQALGTGYELVVNEDYKAEYFNNINQGTAMVIITGLRSQARVNAGQEVLADIIKGIQSMTTFKITAHDGELTYPAATKVVEYEYNTTVDHPLDAHDGDGTITFTSSDESVADVSISGVVTIRKAGTTRITATMAADGNYTAASAYYDLTVKPRSLRYNYAKTTPDVTATIAGSTSTGYSVAYSGEAYAPAVVVKDKGRTLQENKHYTYSVTNNVNCGTATITIKGMDNYSSENDDAITLNFTINAVTPTISMTSTDAVILAKGQKFTRKATTNHGEVTYSSSPAGIVDISADGVVTAKTTTATNEAEKTVTITASVAADTEHEDKPNWVATSKTYTMTVVESDWKYGYTGTVQTWICPVDGIWELEAMGAKGADASGFNGGRGADVAGQLFIKKGQKIYIYVGQGGGTWNGGGTGTTNGGGATDFALKNADWDSNDHLNSRIIVAGGGGGALYWSTGPQVGVGGDGGGEGEGISGQEGYRADYQGETGNGGSHPGGGGKINGGGTRTSGATNGADGTFGKGGSYSGSDPAGGGGGGWYGGASGATGSSNNRQGSGGGGSSFIYNATNRAAANNYTVALPPSDNYFTNDLEITPTILITGGSPDANGQARITYKSAE